MWNKSLSCGTLEGWNFWGIWSVTCRFWGCDRGKWACKKVAGTLFDTVGVVE